MAMGRRTKAEFREEFYKRNAYIRSFFVAQDNLRAYQECHVMHQCRRFARIVMYKQNRTVATGSISHSLSRNQLEETNRGPTGEIPGCSDDGYSTDYDSEGDEGMERILASMPSQPPRSVMPPTTDGGAGEDAFQPPDPFPSERETPPLPPASEAVQAYEWLPSDEPLSSDDEPPGLESSSDHEDKAVMPPPGASKQLSHIDLVLSGTGPPLLTFSMDQLAAAVDLAWATCLQMFKTATDKELKKEEAKKEEEEDECMDGNVALDGQDQDADKDEEKGGDPSLT